MMKNVLLTLFIAILLIPCLGRAQKDEPYPLAAHVTRSEVIFISSGDMVGPYSVLDATIDGHRYRLLGIRFANTKFSLGMKPTSFKVGDYKARMLEDKPVNSAQYFRQYEFLLADGSKLKFDVIGESE